MVCYVKLEDISEIKRLWKGNNDVLGIPFNDTILQLIKNETFYCIKNERNEIIAFCGYQFLKRKDKIKITKLFVKKEERRKGLATKLIKEIIKNTQTLQKEYIVYCKNGAENNNFYDKIGFVIELVEKKTIIERIYKINIEYLLNNEI